MRSAPTLKIWMTPFASVAMLEKLALLKIALWSAPAPSRSSWRRTSSMASAARAASSTTVESRFELLMTYATAECPRSGRSARSSDQATGPSSPLRTATEHPRTTPHAHEAGHEPSQQGRHERAGGPTSSHAGDELVPITDRKGDGNHASGDQRCADEDQRAPCAGEVLPRRGCPTGRHPRARVE